MSTTNKRDWEKEFDKSFVIHCSDGDILGKDSKNEVKKVKSFIRQLELDIIARCSEIIKNKMEKHNEGCEHVYWRCSCGKEGLEVRNLVREDIATAITSLNKTI